VFANETPGPGSGADQVDASIVQVNKASFSGCQTISATVADDMGMTLY
jgi:hypothetical protein